MTYSGCVIIYASQHTHCKCSMEATHNSVNVKLGIKVMKFAKNLIN